MSILRLPEAGLAWLGRQGTRALAASIFLGLAVPQLAAYVKPHLAATVFVLLLFSYLRTDPAALGRALKSPGMAMLASLWVMAVVPLLLGTIYVVSGLREAMPELYTIMILQCAIAPITSTAAFVALMGLDVAFSLVGLIICNALSPLTTVAISYIFLGASRISPMELGGKLLFFFLVSGVVAYAIRRIAGQRWIESKSNAIDGLNVIAVFIFAIAAMDGVPRHFIDNPIYSLGLLAVILTLAMVMIGMSALVFARIGFDRALVVGLLNGFRNLGVVMAALGGTLPETAWFYFALAQFPIYLLPGLLKLLARRQARSR